MNKEEMIRKIKRAVTDKELLEEILVNQYIMELDDRDADGNIVLLRFHIVLTAIHLGMYEEAMDIIRRMRGLLDRGTLTGVLIGKEIFHSYFGVPISGTSTGKTAIINYKQILMAHCDCPKQLIRMIYERLDIIEDNTKKHLYKDYGHINYQWDIENNEYMRIFYGTGYYRQMALGLLSIRSKCPEMLSNMFEKVNNKKVHMPVEGEKDDPEKYKKILAGYTLFVSVVFLCLKDDREMLVRFCEKVMDYEIKVRSQDSYIKYRDEYRKYVAMIKGLKPTLSELNDDMLIGRKDVRYCVILMRIMASLYVVWTGKFEIYEPEVSREAESLLKEIGKELREVAGDSPLWILKQDEYIQLGSVPAYEKALYFSQLLRYGCGYDLNIDATDIREFRFLSECTEDLVKRVQNSKALGKDGCQMIGMAIECLETLGVMTNMDKLRGDPKLYSENIKLIEDIADKIFELGNLELFEVAIKKNLIPEYMYQSLIAKKTDTSVRVLPCLIAYKAKAKRR